MKYKLTLTFVEKLLNNVNITIYLEIIWRKLAQSLLNNPRH